MGLGVEEVRLGREEAGMAVVAAQGKAYRLEEGIGLVEHQSLVVRDSPVVEHTDHQSLEEDCLGFLAQQ
jgi:hypothetical protein